MGYDAFVCHVSRLDAPVALRVRSELHRLNRRPFQLRAARVFVDRTGTNVGELPGQIRRALEQSRNLIVLVRPELASRPWCIEELETWFGLPGKPLPLLVVCAGADLQFDPQTRTLAQGAVALPGPLARAYGSEPCWADLREPIEAGRWIQEVGKLAVPLHPHVESVDQLIGEDLAQQRRLMRLRNGAITALAVLTVAAAASAVWALNRQVAAEHRAREAQARGFAARAIAEVTRDPLGAIRLVGSGMDIETQQPIAELSVAASEVLDIARQSRRLEPPFASFGDVRALVQSRDGSKILVAARDRAWLLGAQGQVLAPPLNLEGEALAATSACVTGDDELMLITSGGHNARGELLTGATVLPLSGAPPFTIARDHDARLTAAACGADRRELFVGDASGEGLRVDVDGRRLLRMQQATGSVSAMLWDGYELSLFTASSADAAATTEPSDGAVELRSTVTSATLSGQWHVLGTEDGPIRKSELGSSIRMNGHRGAVRAIVPIGEVLASAGDDRTIRLWTGFGAPMVVLPGHRAAITALLWRERDKELWSADSGGAVWVWSLSELTAAATRNPEFAVTAAIPHGFIAAELRRLSRITTDGTVEVDAVPLVRPPIALAAFRNGIAYVTDPERAGGKPAVELWVAQKNEAAQRWSTLGEGSARLLPTRDGALLVGGGYEAGRYSGPSLAVMMRTNFPEAPGVDQLPTADCGLYLLQGPDRRIEFKAAHGDSITALAENPLPANANGIRFASGGIDGRLRFWSADLRPVGEPFTFFSDDVSETNVSAIAFARDGRTIYVATSAGLIDAPGSNMKSRRIQAIDVNSARRLWQQEVGDSDVVELHVLEDSIALRTSLALVMAEEGRRAFVRRISFDGAWLGPPALSSSAPVAMASVDGEHLLVLDAQLHVSTMPASSATLKAAVSERLQFHERHDRAGEYATRAQRADEAGNRAEALEQLNAAIGLEPASHTLRSVRARLLLDLARPGEAIVDYDAAVVHNPYLVTARIGRARAYAALAQWPKALEDANAAVRYANLFMPLQPIVGAPDKNPLGKQMADVLEQTVRRVNPAALGDALELRARVYVELGNLDNAVSDLDELLRLGRNGDQLQALRQRIEKVRNATSAAMMR